MTEIDRTLCETCAFQEYYPAQKPCLLCLGGSPLRVTGDRYLKYIPTHADRIRKMTDEELAEFLTNVSKNEREMAQSASGGIRIPWKEKLKMEAEDG